MTVHGWEAHLPAGSATGPDLGAGGTLVGAWLDTWAANSTHAVLEDAGGRRVGAGELAERTAAGGAVLTHANLLAGAHALRAAWRWTPADRLVLALPLFHMHGLGVGVHGSLSAGGTALVLPRFDPAGVAEAVAGRGGTMFFGVPTM